MNLVEVVALGVIQAPLGYGGRMTRRRYELTDKQWLITEPLLAISACD
ncbi:hypothetical protein VHN57_07450 [Sphingobium sp. WW5]|uniref:Uncharacterized protein n=1 Tax=Sphingobium yanoikuyae TaxID=13690 RepID=A0A6M4G5C9_SPHYA|nr:hypothetical protein [Sphingobium yanoikuyae]QJR02435.1 hypothetical protein HH800_09740 [Sphingobium yanoikuyae]